MKWMGKLVCLLVCFTNLFGSEHPFTAFQLKNGIKVYLKPLSLDNPEVTIQWASKNGFATFSSPSAAAYKIAPDIAVNSNHASLFDGEDDAIDFYYSVEPLYSYWVLDTTSQHVKKALSGLFHLLSTPVWNDALLKSTENNLLNEKDNKDNSLIDLYQLNQIPPELIRPEIRIGLPLLTLKEIAQAYRNLFLDPAHSTLIIAGNFEEDEVKKWVAEIFSSIPEQVDKPAMNPLTLPLFPSDPKENSSAIKKKFNPQITITLPLPYPLDSSRFVETELLALTLEEGLKKEPIEGLQNISSIDVSLELPLYPLLDAPWIMITYQSSSKKYREEGQALMMLIKDRLQNGVDQVILGRAVEQMQISDNFWKNEPEFWLAFLGNQSLMGINPEKTLIQRSQIAVIPLERINENLKRFSPNRYTIFYSNGEAN